MLSVRPKVIEPVFSLYARPLHPEFFQIAASKAFCRKHYEVNIAITNVGHVLSWTDGTQTLTEVLAAGHHEYPDAPVFRTSVLGGEKERTNRIVPGLLYQTSFLTESVEPEMLYLFDKEFSREIETDGLIHRFDFSGRMSLGAVSYIRFESRAKRLFVQSIHTFPDDGSLVRTESIIVLE